MQYASQNVVQNITNTKQTPYNNIETIVFQFYILHTTNIDSY